MRVALGKGRNGNKKALTLQLGPFEVPFQVDLSNLFNDYQLITNSLNIGL